MIGAGRVPNIVTTKKLKDQILSPERGQNVSVIGCGSAAGISIPPFIIFTGKRMIPELLTGATTGNDGYVSTSGKGYSNTDIFTKYVKSHFLKYVQGRDPKQYIILIYDGHRIHISSGLIEWAIKFCKNGCWVLRSI